MAESFPAEPDRLSLTGEYADWLAAMMRSAYSTGVAGQADDWKAFTHDWGFDLERTRGVVLWQSDHDDIVTPAHAHWLALRQHPACIPPSYSSETTDTRSASRRRYERPRPESASASSPVWRRPS